MSKLRVVSDGQPRNTYIFDGSGNVVRGVTKVEIKIDAYTGKAELKLVVNDFNLEMENLMLTEIEERKKSKSVKAK